MTLPLPADTIATPPISRMRCMVVQVFSRVIQSIQPSLTHQNIRNLSAWTSHNKKFKRLLIISSDTCTRKLSFAVANMSNKTAGKKAAAYKAVDEWVKNDQKLGIGSGSTIVFAVERLAERVRNEKLNVVCVPTSFQARQLIIDNGLVLSDLESHPELDVAIDGADEVDLKLNCIKGGGGCQTQEKVVAASSKSFVVIADDSKQSTYLGEKWHRGLPIEVLPFAYKVVKVKIEKILGGTADLRMATQKAGPVVTDNGNLILDWKFQPSPVINWSDISIKLAQITGIVETGLFVNMAVKVYFGTSDGAVNTLEPK